MKRLAVLLLLVVALATGSFFLCYRLGTHPMRHMAEHCDELAWLAHEFKLTPEQRARISELHTAYMEPCAERCKKIDETNARLRSLITAAQKSTPEIDALIRQSADLQTQCRVEMLAHIYAVAAQMPPEAGRAYVAMMQEQVVQPGSMHEYLRPQ